MQLYQSDHELPGTRLIFDTNAIAARLQSAIDRDVSVAISDIRYKPGTSCVVTYRVDAEMDRTYAHAKAFHASDWSTRKQKLAIADEPGNVLLDEEHSLALFRFPADAKLPAIARFVSNPDDFLNSVLFDDFQQKRLLGFKTLAYKPNRRFTGALSFDSGEQLVLKIHDPSTFDRSLSSSDVLKKASSIVAPPRIGRSSRHRALVYGWMDGVQPDLFSIDVVKRKRLMEQIFDFLDRLHHPIRSKGGSLPRQQPSSGLLAIGDYLAEIYPPIGDKVRKLGASIIENLPSKFPSMLIHGDFSVDQILVSQVNDESVRACDFDNCCVGDPTFDFGTLVGQLYYQAALDNVSLAQVEEINEWVVDHLAESGDSSAVQRYRFHQVAATFRLATHPFRSGYSDWIQKTETLIGLIGEQVEAIKRRRDSVLVESFSEPETNASRSGIRELPPGNKVLSDPAFKFVGYAFEPEVAAKVLEQAMPDFYRQNGPWEVVKISVRRHKPGRRCLIEYQLSTARGLQSILGKVSVKRLDRRSFRIQTALYNSCGFSQDGPDGIEVPRPLGQWAPWNMWFQEKVEATEGIAFLEKSRLPSVVGRIAATIAKLHQSDLVPTKRHSEQDELNLLLDRLSVMAVQLPDESLRINLIADRCRSICASISNRPPTPIHRDFYHDQIMFANGRTYLVDLDLVSLGHPALDVGNFLAHLAEDGIRRFDDPMYWRDEEAQIMEHYVDLLPDVSKQDIAAFKAISLARHISISWKIRGRRKSTSSIIQEVDALTNTVLLNFDLVSGS